MTAATGPTPGGDRLPVLDGVRGLAILMVMQGHMWGIIFSVSSQPPTLVIDQWTKRVFGLGWSGVDLFFVLSGFLITGILYDTKGSNNFLRTFYARRFLRLAPVYYLFLLFVLLLVPFIAPIDAVAEVDTLRDIQWWMWSYTINIGNGIKSFGAPLPLVHGAFWSLAVEEQFYLIWPFAVLALPRRPLMVLCCVMIVAAFAFRVALTNGFYESVFTESADYALMPARMDTLALGALVALAARGTELPPLARAAPGVVAMIVPFVVVLFIVNEGLSPIQHVSVARVGLTVVAFLFAAFLIIVLQAKEGSMLYRALTMTPLRAFGKYSYAMYVFHVLTAFVLARVFILNDWTSTVQDSQIPLNIAFSLVATATTFALAWVSWRLVEQPLLQLKKRLPYRDRPSMSAPLLSPVIVDDAARGTAS